LAGCVAEPGGVVGGVAGGGLKCAARKADRASGPNRVTAPQGQCAGRDCGAAGVRIGPRQGQRVGPGLDETAAGTANTAAVTRSKVIRRPNGKRVRPKSYCATTGVIERAERLAGADVERCAAGESNVGKRTQSRGVIRIKYAARDVDGRTRNETAGGGAGRHRTGAAFGNGASRAAVVERAEGCDTNCGAIGVVQRKRWIAGECGEI